MSEAALKFYAMKYAILNWSSLGGVLQIFGFWFFSQFGILRLQTHTETKLFLNWSSLGAVRQKLITAFLLEVENCGFYPAQLVNIFYYFPSFSSVVTGY